MLINKIQINKAIEGSLNIFIPSNISLNTRQDENILKIFEEKASSSINEMIDMEKVKLVPSTDFNMTGITDSICIRLHFLNDLTGTWDQSATTINNIGFTTNDVRELKNVLKKSFVSLKFYDSNDVKTQNLIAYSVCFFDVYDMYRQYIENGYTITGITSEFVIENPILTLKQKSNEGFNLYLYKQDLNKNDFKDIYVKIEFNDALNGKTTLFCNQKAPTNDGDIISDIVRKMFIKVRCKYSNNRFYYFFEGYNNEEKIYDNIKNVINIDVYQAKAK